MMEIQRIATTDVARQRVLETADDKGDEDGQSKHLVVKPKKSKRHLDNGALSQAVLTVLRRSEQPLPTGDVVVAVVKINGYSDASLPLVAREVRRCLRRLEKCNPEVAMSGTREQRFWATHSPF